jgi:hypothetical protein
LDVAKREQEWISRFAKPRDPSDPLRNSNTQEDPQYHIKMLDEYLNTIPLLIPTEPAMQQSILWHADLHLGNIFVEGIKIVSIIDWQGILCLPTFLACKLPQFLQVNGPLLFDLPPQDGLTAEEKRANWTRFEYTQLQRLFLARLRKLDAVAFQAIAAPQALTKQQLVSFAGSSWDDDEGLFLLREILHRVYKNWNEFEVGTSCPMRLSAEEHASQTNEGKKWNQFQDFFNSLGIPRNGWVHHDEFVSKSKILHHVVVALIESAEDAEEAKQAMRALKITSTSPNAQPGDIIDI